MNAIVPTSGAALVPTDMRSAMDLATMMSQGKLVPTHLQGSPGDCLMIIEQAIRWGMSPFAVAQATAVVKGKLSFEGKLVAAAIHTSGILVGRISYEFSETGPDRKVVASGLLKGETEPRTVEVSLASAKTSNEHWLKSPDQMLTYHAARVWARRHAPEVMLGVYSPEEMEPEPIRDTFTGTTIEARAEAQPQQHTAPDRDTVIRVWLGKVRAKLNECQTADDVEAIKQDPAVQRNRSRLEGAALEELIDMLEDAACRVADPDAANEPVTEDVE